MRHKSGQGLLCDLAMGERNPIWDKFYKSQNEDVVGTYKTPAIIIRGEKHNKKWEARLEIVPFIYGVSVPGISQWNLA